MTLFLLKCAVADLPVAASANLAVWYALKVAMLMLPFLLSMTSTIMLKELSTTGP